MSYEEESGEGQELSLCAGDNTFGAGLPEQREFELARQVLRAGTSIGANVEESLAGVSRRDFVSKMGIA